MRKFTEWILISMSLSLFYILRSGLSLEKLSPSYIEKTGAYPYFVLCMCIFMLYIKRERIIASMDNNVNKYYLITGISLATFVIIFPVKEPPFQIFLILLLATGIFIALFGKAALTPFMLLGIYGFSLFFPIIESWTGNLFPQITASILVSLLENFISISYQGQSINFLDTSGERQTYFIDAGCSGIASISIFFSLFFLMILDSPLPWKNTIYLLIFGFAGTSIQNLLRLVILVFSGYWYGSDALWTAHAYAGYILFPIWFTLFVYVYFRLARRNQVLLLNSY